MRANQHMPDQNLKQSRGHARRAPLCYSRQAAGDEMNQARTDGESSVMIAVYGVMTCAAAAFLVVYGGWGL